MSLGRPSMRFRANSAGIRRRIVTSGRSAHGSLARCRKRIGSFMRPSRLIRFEDLAFLKKVAANYDRLARSRRFIVIDSARSPEAVTLDAISAIERRLKPPRKR